MEAGGGEVMKVAAAAVGKSGGVLSKDPVSCEGVTGYGNVTGPHILMSYKNEFYK